ncbi:hypothetical protein P7K49_014948 [Saguinus oedipus]|uniref:Uncharacterized protein n=1 Tax=Saguinus oedipus TaxID=9490 RepID=A0ABQ9V7U3_SAGOE|nr:hypothetical protein P7K49_014948 [Saguinus oedipus]
MASFTLFLVLISVTKAQLPSCFSSLQGIPLPPQSWVVLSQHKALGWRTAVSSAVLRVVRLNCCLLCLHSDFLPLHPFRLFAQGSAALWTLTFQPHFIFYPKCSTVLFEETLASLTEKLPCGGSRGGEGILKEEKDRTSRLSMRWSWASPLSMGSDQDHFTVLHGAGFTKRLGNEKGATARSLGTDQQTCLLSAPGGHRPSSWHPNKFPPRHKPPFLTFLTATTQNWNPLSPA